MSKETLILGLEFAHEHELTQKEIGILLKFMDRAYTTTELAEELKINKSTLHGLIFRLKLKSLLILENSDSKGTFKYAINPKIF